MKQFRTAMALFLLLAGIVCAQASETTRGPVVMKEAMPETPVARPQAKVITKGDVKEGAVETTSEARNFANYHKAKRKVAKTGSVSDLTSSKYLLSRTTTGTVVTNSVSVTSLEGDSIAIAGFGYSDVTVKAKVNVAEGTVTIPSQYITTVNDNVVCLCSYDHVNGTYSTTANIEGVIVDNSNIHITSGYGFFVTEGASKGGYLTIGLMKYGDVCNYNGKITNKVVTYANNTFTTDNRTVTSQEENVYMYQLSDEQIRVSHVPAQSDMSDLLMNVTSSSSLTIDPQPMFQSSLYGAFVCYPMKETVSGTSVSVSASILSPIEASLDATKQVITLNPWMIANTTAGKFAALLESSTISLNKAITTPSATTLTLEGEGTAENPYLIGTMADLATFAKMANTSASVRGASKTGADDNAYVPVFSGKYVKLTADLDWKTYDKPVPTIGTTDYRFDGTFDGGNHTIANMTVSDYAYDYCGLFGAIAENGTVKNLKMTDVFISSLGYKVGAIAGQSCGVIDSCEVQNARLTASAGYNVGGIAGYTYGPITHCKATGLYESALGYMGGITGRSYSDIKHCEAQGRIVMTGKQVFAGGIAGYISRKANATALAQLTDCSYSGSQVATGSEISLGGIAGMAANTQVERCFSSATLVSGSSVASYLGGLIGCIWQDEISDCYATGYINNSTSVGAGGFIGHSSEIESCTGTTVKSSYAATILRTASTDSLRGFKGDGDKKVTFENCYYDAQLVNVASDKGLSTADMTAAAGLPGFDAAKWTFTEGMYPRLKGTENSTLADVATAAIHFEEGETTDMVKSNFTFKAADNVEWKAYKDGQLDAESGYAFKFSNGTAVLNYSQYTDTIYAVKGNVSKVFFVKIAPMPFNGEGTAESPWEIGTREELAQFSDITNNTGLGFEGKYFKMIADIDMKGDTINPICKDKSAKITFQGTFDGCGHKVSNVAVYSVEFYGEGNTAGKPADEVNPKSDNCYYNGGLFGNIGASGVVKNLIIDKDCQMHFFSEGGAIAGSNAGLIENCKNYATVRAYFGNGGGIVGDLKQGGIVRNCYNSGAVYAGNYQSGGIAGRSVSATIENCVNTGYVASEFINTYQAEGKQSKAGGIVGNCEKSSIANCLNTGNVKSYKAVGGIAGNTTGTATAPSAITHCVNYGQIYTLNEIASIGTIAGTTAYTKVDSCYALSKMQAVERVSNGACEGAALASPQELSGAELDLDKATWTMEAGSYPVLTFAKDEPQLALDCKAVVAVADADLATCLSQDASLGNTANVAWSLSDGKGAFAISNGALKVTVPATGLATDTLVASMGGMTRAIPVASMNRKVLPGEGTADNPFQIAKPADMETLRNAIVTTGYDFDGNYFKVMNDLDFTDFAYSPVGGEGAMFNGVIDGDNKVISHLTYNAADDKTALERGLIGVLGAKGELKNLTIDSTCTFAAYSKVGAFAGSIYGKIDHCVNYAKVVAGGTTYAGGVAGFASAGSAITNCKNFGEVSSKTTYAGGILGGALAGAAVEIDSCQNSGSIAGTSKIGGIVGSASTAITRCVNNNDAAVTATTNYAGGIVGEALNPSSVRLSHNHGNVKSDQYMGGIVGMSALHYNGAEFVADSCYNAAAISPALTSAGKGYAAGIVAYAYSGAVISNCYNTGDIATDVASVPYLGGIVATMSGAAASKSRIENCYNTGNISGKNFIAGIAGRFSGDANSEISNCHNLGDIDAAYASSSYAAGIVANGGYNMTDCWNAGAITGKGTYIGGLSGYMTGKEYVYERNFNVGPVEGTSTSKYVGGLVGMGRPVMYDCCNFANIIGGDAIGGLVGYPGNAAASSYLVSLNRSYNTGALSALKGTNVGNACANNASCKYLEVNGIYYDKTMSAETDYDKTFEGLHGFEHSDMLVLDMGDNFQIATACYPSLTRQTANAYHNFGVATVQLADGDSFDNVTKSFKLGTPEGVTWTCSNNLTIKGENVVWTDAMGQEASVTVTVGNLSRTYKLTIMGELSGVNDLNTNAKTVLSRMYYNVNGQEIANPSNASGVVIEKTIYTDGSVSARKMMAGK